MVRFFYCNVSVIKKILIADDEEIIIEQTSDCKDGDLIIIAETTLKPKLKFIVMSGHVRPAIEKNGIDPPLYFFKKLLDIDSLIKKVASELDNK